MNLNSCKKKKRSNFCVSDEDERVEQKIQEKSGWIFNPTPSSAE